MNSKTSRRDFLSAGLSAGFALPVMGTGSRMGLWPGESTAKTAGSQIKLDFRTLGRTGLKVTTLGFGCMITSDPSVIERAADIGINYFDTARGYQHGNNERMVGAALGARRKQVILSTKSGAENKEGLLKDLDTSLRELNTDYVDIWYLHGRGGPSDIRDDMIEAQQLAKKQGKIRFAGVSTHGGQQQLLPWLAQKDVFDVVLTAYNFSMDPDMDQAIAVAAKSGMGVVAMKVMAGGFRDLKPGNPFYAKLQAGWGHARRAEVGHQQAHHLYHHSQHDGYGPVGSRTFRPWRIHSHPQTKSCWPRTSIKSSRFIAACAASAMATAKKDCRSPMCCASSLTPTVISSSHSGARDSCS